eukprot:TRINITY_DN2413_c0_g10_i1.p2 TRINITY_DN2413_c0_g10~~TRINITY_DN2413_c0_g10_i1.p2  ORF type:complete len:372 (+),score=75.60 TRINITY_DN2413_c0_g10_i1:162-1118(+)
MAGLLADSLPPERRTPRAAERCVRVEVEASEAARLPEHCFATVQSGGGKRAGVGPLKAAQVPVSGLPRELLHLEVFERMGEAEFDVQHALLGFWDLEFPLPAELSSATAATSRCPTLSADNLLEDGVSTRASTGDAVDCRAVCLRLSAEREQNGRTTYTRRQAKNRLASLSVELEEYVRQAKLREALQEGLQAMLAEMPDDPFAFLADSLGRSAGVCGALAPSPARAVGRGAATGAAAAAAGGLVTPPRSPGACSRSWSKRTGSASSGCLGGSRSRWLPTRDLNAQRPVRPGSVMPSPASSEVDGLDCGEDLLPGVNA